MGITAARTRSSWAASKHAPCSIIGFKGTRVALQLFENLQREALTPHATATGVQQQLGAPIKQEEIAAQLGKSEA